MRAAALSLFSLASRQILTRYIGVSAIALGADVAITAMLIFAGSDPTLAAAVGYSCGIIVHWWLSARAVFSDRVAEKGLDRTRQKAMFVASALLGLGLTVLIMWLGVSAGLNPLIAKAAAVIISFFATFLLRNHIVFRPWIR